MKILINNSQKQFNLNLKDIQRLAKRILKILRLPAGSVLSLVFCDDKSITEINKRYRDKPEATDVLSFPMPRLSGKCSAVPLGDIVISLETACRQAKELGHSLKSEIAFLMIHGVLHLSGFDHIKDEDKKVMCSKETDLYKALLRAGLVHDRQSAESAVIGRTIER